jgi:hypothetical protein
MKNIIWSGTVEEEAELNAEMAIAGLNAACDMMLENWIDPPPYCDAVIDLLKTTVARDREEWKSRFLGTQAPEPFELTSE